MSSTAGTGQEWEYAPPDALVFRGGRLEPVSAWKNARDVYEEYGVWGLCVTAGVGTEQELLPQVRARSAELMVTTVEAVTGTDDHGFVVVREPNLDWPAALIVFPNGFTPEAADDLRDAMMASDPIPNPKYKGK